MTRISDVVGIVAMLGAAAACTWAAVAAFRRIGTRAQSAEVAIWGGCAALFGAFAAVKVSGVLVTVGGAVRSVLRSEGIYGDRKVLQVALIGAAVLGMAFAIWHVRHIAKRWRRYRWTFIGIAAIAGFGCIRVISLHELEAMHATMAAAKVIVETLACAVAAWGALSRVRRLRADRGHGTEDVTLPNAGGGASV